MNKIKDVTDGLPSGYIIEVKSSFGWCEWNKRDEVGIHVYPKYKGYEIDKFYKFIPKPESKGIVFKKRPVRSWKQECEYQIEKLVELARGSIERYEFESGVESKLLDVLDEF